MGVTHHILLDHVLDTFLEHHWVRGSPPGAGDLGGEKIPGPSGDSGPEGDTENMEVKHTNGGGGWRGEPSAF